MARILQVPHLQLGDAPLGSAYDQATTLWQTDGALKIGESFVLRHQSGGDGDEDTHAIALKYLGNGNWEKTYPYDDPDEGDFDFRSWEIRDEGGQVRVNFEITAKKLPYNSHWEQSLTHDPIDGEAENFEFQFATRLAPGEEARLVDDDKIVFFAYGDAINPRDNGGHTHEENVENFHIVQEQIMRDAVNENDPSENADFALLLGDIVQNKGVYSEYDYWFSPAGVVDDHGVEMTTEASRLWSSSHINFPAYGNHDAQSGGDAYKDAFAVPIDPNAPQGGEELYYSFDYGDAHFVTFDSNIWRNPDGALDDAIDYLEQDLAASGARWKIVYAHHPVAGAPDKINDHKPSTEYYQKLVETLNKYDVDVFMTGHSHTYSTSYPLIGEQNGKAVYFADEDFEYSKGAGVVQVTSGTGGTPLRDQSVGYDGFDMIANGFSQATEPKSEFGYARVEIEGDRLSVDYITAVDVEGQKASSSLSSFRIVDDGKDVPVRGTDARDGLEGGARGEYLYGLGGADRIEAEGGNDHLYAGDDDDLAYGGDGRDSVYGDEGDDGVRGDAGHDRVFGGEGDDRVYGDEGKDKLYGGRDDDVVYGGDGRDSVYGDEGDDGIRGDAGHDCVFGGEGDDRVYGDEGKDELYGGDGQDKLEGGDDKDLIYGGDNSDRLYGQDGNDSVIGDKGNDILYGGDGRDKFYFYENDGRDKILDFKIGNDQLAFRGVARSELNIFQYGSHTVIDYQDNNRIYIYDTDRDDLDWDDFSFA